MNPAPEPTAAGTQPAPIRLSVIVPSYNSGHVIGACLRSLAPWADDPQVEILVVDSSTDGTETYIRAAFPWVRLHHLPQRTFPGPARNRGAALARGALLAFTDADCVVARDWVPAILAVFDRHPAEAACVGRIGNHNPGNLIGWVSFLTEFNDYLGRQRRRPVRALPTFCAVFRRDVFERYGGFPAEVAWLEDMILCARLLAGGERLFMEPSLRVRHHNRGALRAFLHHQFRLGQFFAHSRYAADLPGARALRRTAGAIPLLAAWRAARAYQRTLCTAPGAFLILLALTPLYLAGCVAWMRGVRLGRRECLAPPALTKEAPPSSLPQKS